MRGDRALGVVLVAAGAAVAVEATTFDVYFLTDPLGPKALPLLVAVLLIGAGVGIAMGVRGSSVANGLGPNGPGTRGSVAHGSVADGSPRDGSGPGGSVANGSVADGSPPDPTPPSEPNTPPPGSSPPSGSEPDRSHPNSRPPVAGADATRPAPGRLVRLAPGRLVRMAGAVAVLAAYAVVLPAAGFVATTTAMAAGLSLLFGGPPWRSLAAALVLSLALLVLFQGALGLPLPVGSWWILE